MTFQEAVEQTPRLANAYRPGLQALEENHRAQMTCQTPRNLSGSVNLDAALKESLPSEPRWDYGVGLRLGGGGEKVFWIEVHPASSTHIEDVLKKHRRLKQWLEAESPLLEKMPREYVWIASGSVSLPPGSQQRRKLAEAGIRFAGSRLVLK